MPILTVTTTDGNVTVKCEASNRYLVSLPYGRFGSTVWINRTREDAMLAAANYLA